MVSLSFILLICASTISRVLSVPHIASQRSEHSIRQTLPSPSSGTSNGYYFFYWSDGNTQEEVTFGIAGKYRVNWSGNALPFLVGKGWNPGSAKSISYAGNFTPESGTAYLSVYGWTTSPLIEYRIVESNLAFDPSTDSSYQYKGNVTSDGGSYDIYLNRTPNEGYFDNETFAQYWSIRTENRVGGTVNTANHFDAWGAVGLRLGTFNYQLLATEGDGGSGSSSIIVL